MEFTELVKLFINRHRLISRNDEVIVGLSGGADSVALLTVLHSSGYRIKAAHCNFHLRGEESMRDESFCRELCDELGIELVVKNFDVGARRKERGESVEMACRSLRYEWWESLLHKKYGSVIAVGHHREDNVETFFLNLLRGSSLTGLKGMLPKNGNVIRPLLERSRSEILDYIKTRGLSYVTDSTNADNYYKRNRLRNKILPLLEAEFPGAVRAIGETMGHLRDNYGLYKVYVDDLRRRYMDGKGVIDLPMLLDMEQDPRMALYEILSEDGLNMSQAEDIVRSMTGSDSSPASGKVFAGKNVTYLLDRGKLMPMPSGDVVTDHDVVRAVDLKNAPFSMRMMTGMEFNDLKAKKGLRTGALYADAEILDNEPVFSMRGWIKGDRMKPFGMRGSKLLSDLFSNAKVPVTDKAMAVVVLRNSDIIWVPGIRCSALFPVTDRTKNVIEVTYSSKQ